MTYIAKPLIIKTKTNLHVGSESINYDIVDKTVQRDSISYLPIINASSLKGALRYHFKEHNKVNIDFLFGSEEDRKNNKTSSQGNIKFLDSYLLFLPLRANNQAFYYVTSQKALLAYCHFYENLSLDFRTAKELINKLKDNSIYHALEEDTMVEDISCTKSTEDMAKILTLLGLEIDASQVAVLSESYFIDAIKHLPIIARNKLKDGKSENLWYEEIVPRESLFYTAVLDYTHFSNRIEAKANHSFQNFYTEIQEGFVQIGANASIGFGLCKFFELTKTEA